MLSKGMKEVYRSVWSEMQHYDTGMLEPDDDEHEVDESLIFCDGRVMSKAEYDSLT